MPPANGDPPPVAVTTDQDGVIAFLADPASYRGVDRVDRFETHGNLIFLAGEEAWKIKRAVRFPYMDFSTLEKRRAACRREVEVNRRFAPEIYLGCMPITRTPDGAFAFGGGGEIIEWAVHMRRFEQSALLSHVAASGGIGPELAKAVADAAFAAHATAERAVNVGSPAMADLLGSVCGSLAGQGVFAQHEVAGFSRAARRAFARAAAVLDERAQAGCVRRCHGDLHLANIVLWRGRPVFYDAIEFDESVATIDILYDLAFLLMDLDRHGQRAAANAVLNRYLWRSNAGLDLAGLTTLPLFLGLRAAVRAMVTADRAAQEQAASADQDLDRARAYLHAAVGYVTPQPPRLIAVGGLSGTGKSTLAAALAPSQGPAPGAVHLRSDLERKTMFAVGELDRLPAQAYSREAGLRVYGTLLEKARKVLAAGHAVIVDAVYAAPEEREDIERVAASLHVPFQGLWLSGDAAMLAARIEARRNDASDATTAILRTQLEWDIGALSPAWAQIDAGGTREATLEQASALLDAASRTSLPL